jgi:hypothetical protein
MWFTDAAAGPAPLYTPAPEAAEEKKETKDKETFVPSPRVEEPSSGPPKGGKKVGADKLGLTCAKTLTFEDAQSAIRCIARGEKNDVWCADWKGRLQLRHKDKPADVMQEWDGDAAVRALCLVPSPAGRLLWIGREATTIPVYSVSERAELVQLASGHGGGVTCMVTDQEGTVWSGSVDFTVRQWKIGAKGETKIKKGCYVSPGYEIHGHKNRVNCLLKVGPTLWTGSADKSIRVWRCMDGKRINVMEDAHEGSVYGLASVDGSVWSCGEDGVIVEWDVESFTANRRWDSKWPPVGVATLVPVGTQIWASGQSPEIAILTANVKKLSAFDAHEKYVSSLCLVERYETRVLWSCSVKDKKLKVWKRIETCPTDVDPAEAAAANKMFASQGKKLEEELASAQAAAAQLASELENSSGVFAAQLQDLAEKLAVSEEERDQFHGASDALAQDAAELRLVLDQAQRDVAGLKEEKAQLEAALAAEREKSAKELAAAEEAHRQELEALKASHAEELARVQAKLDAEAKARQEADEEISRLMKLLNGAQMAGSRSSQELAELKRLFEDMKLELESLKRENLILADDARKYRAEKALARKLEDKLRQLEHEIAEAVRLRDAALENERQMAMKYRELDVFKLDVIARELKKLDKELEALRRVAKDLQTDAKKISEYTAQHIANESAQKSLDLTHDLHAHLRDVINECLSEMQKLHIGVAMDDYTAAHELKDGGVMAGYVEAPEDAPDLVRPEHLQSGAGWLRQEDELRRERERDSTGFHGKPVEAPSPPTVSRTGYGAR